MWSFIAEWKEGGARKSQDEDGDKTFVIFDVVVVVAAAEAADGVTARDGFSMFDVVGTR